MVDPTEARQTARFGLAESHIDRSPEAAQSYIDRELKVAAGRIRHHLELLAEGIEVWQKTKLVDEGAYNPGNSPVLYEVDGYSVIHEVTASGNRWEHVVWGAEGANSSASFSRQRIRTDYHRKLWL